MLKAIGIEGDYWITMRYERLPDLCFGCGRIGHAVKECAERTNNETLNKDKHEFGAWLKFQGSSKPTKKLESPRKNSKNPKDQSVNEEENLNKGMSNEEDVGKEINVEKLLTPV